MDQFLYSRQHWSKYLNALVKSTYSFDQQYGLFAVENILNLPQQTIVCWKPLFAQKLAQAIQTSHKRPIQSSNQTEDPLTMRHFGESTHCTFRTITVTFLKPVGDKNIEFIDF